MTGNPYPRTPEERMYLAPHVRNYVQNIGRQGTYPVQQESGIKRAVKAVGKTALAAGLLVGGAMAAHHYLKDDDDGGGGGGGGHDIADSLDNIHDAASDVLDGNPLAHPFKEKGTSMRLTGTVMTKLPLLQPAQGPEAAESDIQVGTPFETPVQYEEGQDALIGQPKPGAVEKYRASEHYARMKQQYPGLADIESPTKPASSAPGMAYGEEVIPTEIRVRQAAKGAAPGSAARESLRTKPVTETERLATAQVPGPHPQDYSLDEHVALATVAKERGDMAMHLKHAGEITRRIKAGEAWRPTEMTNQAIEAVRRHYSTEPSAPEYVGTGTTVQPVRGGQGGLGIESIKQEQMNYPLTGGMGDVLDINEMEAGPAASHEQEIAAKNFLHRGVEKIKNISDLQTYGFDPKERAQMQKYGYNPQTGVGTEYGPMTQQVGTAHSSLLAEQLQREAGRQAEQAGIYKKLQAQRTPYAPHPADMAAIHGKGFFHPSAYGRM